MCMWLAAFYFHVLTIRVHIGSTLFQPLMREACYKTAYNIDERKIACHEHEAVEQREECSRMQRQRERDSVRNCALQRRRSEERERRAKRRAMLYVPGERRTTVHRLQK